MTAGARLRAVGRSPAGVARAGGRDGVPAARGSAAAGVLAVAAALRSGAAPAAAWRRGWGLDAPDGVPHLADVAARCPEAHAAAVVAAAALAVRTGAPLAAVLERTAAALAEDADVEVQRQAALAGPRATVRVLTALPVVGIGLGWALGADPLSVLLDGAAGSSLGLGALVLTWLGGRWSGALVRRARAAGRPA